MVTRQLSPDSSIAPREAPCAELDAVVALLLDALKKLADAGEVDPACRIAGRACGVLRRRAPAAEHRFNALLHRLTPRLQEQNPD